MKRTIRSIQLFGFAVLVGAMISGCTSVKHGLIGEKQANVRPFAEQTVASLAVERIDFRESEFAYLRAISKPGAPEVENLRRLLALADEFRDEVVYYSVELVRIAEMNVTEQERVQEYADAIGDMRNQFASNLNVSDSEFAAIEADIRSHDDMLKALGSAQPLIDLNGKQFENLVREIEEQALTAVVKYYDDLIENHYSEFMA